MREECGFLLWRSLATHTRGSKSEWSDEHTLGTKNLLGKDGTVFSTAKIQAKHADKRWQAEDRQTDRQTDKQPGKQTDIQTGQDRTRQDRKRTDGWLQNMGAALRESREHASRTSIASEV